LTGIIADNLPDPLAKEREPAEPTPSMPAVLKRYARSGRSG
jgi:hypothetical protein